MIEVVKAARDTKLTLLATLKTRLELTVVSHDAVLTDFIETASIDISNLLLNRRRIVTARADFLETCPAFGDQTLQLSRCPIAAVSSVVFDSSAVTDYLVYNKEAGQLFRELGWSWTAKSTGWNRYTEHLPRLLYYDPASGSETPDYAVTYTAGWILPAVIAAKTTLSASATDNSFNDSANGLPEVVAGDIIKTAGFVQAANNGQFVVVSRTAGKIIVGNTLVTEAAGASVTIDPRNLPKDIEEACIEAAKDWFMGRAERNTIASESLDGKSVSYFRQDRIGSLPQRALGLLRNYL